MFSAIFTQTLALYTNDPDLIIRLTNELEQHYSEKARHYHNLYHLDNLLAALLPVKESIHDWDMVVFAIAWHDIIYNTLKQDNEEQSAELAVKRLQELEVTAERIAVCREHILATKGHLVSENADTNYFTDADLSILGAKSNTYHQYAQQIRQEYKFYPDLLYNPGRRKVLRHFLEMEHIFKTAYFSGKYEQQARINLQMELDSL
ncbi:HD domain-containing protein [Chitinophagaceae bacterium MMS25-I14]